ncbi:DUF711 family protein [Lacticaseibacillus camelliae]|uniref:DUF711 family protein n=1 Tax=Lacticaseibacillus camelliae TaxID=381742 RepID=UPI0034E1CF0A
MRRTRRSNKSVKKIKQTAFKVSRMGQFVGKVAAERLGVPFNIVDLSLAPTRPATIRWPRFWKRWG